MLLGSYRYLMILWAHYAPPLRPLLGLWAGPAYTQRLAWSNQAEPRPAEGSHKTCRRDAATAPSRARAWGKAAKAARLNRGPGLVPPVVASELSLPHGARAGLQEPEEGHLVFCKEDGIRLCVGNEGVTAFLWVLWAFYFIQCSAAAQHELTEPQQRLTSTTAIICEEWERAMCCTSFFSRLLIFFCLPTGTRASTQRSLSWGAWQRSPGLADLMKPNKVICTLSILRLGDFKIGRKGAGGIRHLDLGPCYHSYHKHHALDKLTEIIYWNPTC